MISREDADARLWPRVNKNGPTPAGLTTPCWTWTGATADKGHGRISGKKGKRHSMFPTHRISWEYHFGPIPDGLHCLHKCDSPRCVQPDHLFLGTNLDNIADMVAKRRHRFGATKPLAKLDDEKVRQIFRFRSHGHLQRQIAIHFGITQSVVSMVLSRKIWSHVNL